MSSAYILAVDQGTSATKCIVFDSWGRIVAKAAAELRSYYPAPGFVEQNPEEIYQSVLTAVKKCLDNFVNDIEKIITCGISNQRETFLLWDESGEPLYNAVVWQCKRSVEICTRLKDAGIENDVREKTGLVIDPYFSGTKLLWLYENDEKIRMAVDSGKAFFGTVDTWLLFKLTGGQSYFTDFTNASRTMLFNIRELTWDSSLSEQLHLKNLNLPPAKPSTYNFGATDFDGILPHKIKIAAMIGDSHAAAFGEGLYSPGVAKATLGTGSSILLNTKHQLASKGMMTTICWSTHDRVDYALEGIIVSCGSTIKWLQEQLGLFAESAETEAIAQSVDSNNGVYLIPAFSGLGAPYWKMDLKAAILGLTFDCNKNHIIRAALESIPFQIKDVISTMEKNSDVVLKELKVDGGISANYFVMQFLADLLQTNVTNIGIEEVSSLGVAFLAGLECGVFEHIGQLQSLIKITTTYTPGTRTDQVIAAYHEWQDAVNYLIGNQR